MIPVNQVLLVLATLGGGGARLMNVCTFNTDEILS